MKRKYIKPFIEIKNFSRENIVTTSVLTNAVQEVKNQMGSDVTAYTADWNSILDKTE